MEMLRLGSIASPVGIKGEVKVYLYTDSPEIFSAVGYVSIDGVRHDIQTARIQKGMAVLKLSCIADRNEAERYRGKELFIEKADAPPLPEDTYYIRDLIGLRVVDPDGLEIGRLSDVIKNSAQDLYEVEKADGRKFLVPAVDAFVRGIDLSNGTICIDLIEGLDTE